ncbi:macrolide ABC transporter ATP-binding protein [Paenibacillus riograndensis]|uniref:Macrolide ABC transporter ATP-binding protein n=1 Tax=Paenibacillus riograndensis TaxID=483937 RepID=A0A132TVW8_9BACL|nr:ABC transporter ATP-binding protein [Paenibacillus riograndensis]KWX75507.1 macrolide ABC transporter ATP-binding protein [Paenibacillus riograndensis]
MSIIVETKNVSKSYEMGGLSTEILKNVNLQINKGEFISIVGSSGSGKSTLLYLIGGLDKPSAGKIEILGKEISVMKDKDESIMRRRDIGFVFQFYNLIPNLSVEENIMLPVLLDGKDKSSYQEKLDGIIEIVGLSERRKHTPRELSGGQQQRVAIARALINEPELILADEPIGNLDSTTGMEIMELFRKINKERGKTIIQVTHSQEATVYGNRIIRLKDGVLQKEA